MYSSRFLLFELFQMLPPDIVLGVNKGSTPPLWTIGRGCRGTTERAQHHHRRARRNLASCGLELPSILLVALLLWPFLTTGPRGVIVGLLVSADEMNCCRQEGMHISFLVLVIFDFRKVAYIISCWWRFDIDPYFFELVLTHLFYRFRGVSICSTIIIIPPRK